MSISQIETLTDNTTMCIAVVFILVIAILIAIAAIDSVVKRKSITKKPLKSFDDLMCKVPSYKDQMLQFIFDESIRDLSETITSSDSAQAVINTYNQ